MIESLKHQAPPRKGPNRRRKIKSKAGPARSKPDRSAARGSYPAGRHHVLGLLTGTTALLLLLALASEAGPRWTGPLGHDFAGALLRPLGALALAVPLFLAALAGLLLGLARPSLPLAWRVLTGFTGCVAALLCTALLDPRAAFLGYPLAGHWVSGLALPLAGALSVVGGTALAFALAFTCFSIASGHSLSRALIATLRTAGRGLATAGRWLGASVSTAVQEHREARGSAGEDDQLDPQELDDAVAEEAERRAHIASRPALRAPSSSRLEARDAREETPDPDAEHEVAAADEELDAGPPEILTIGEDARIRNGSRKLEAEPIALTPDLIISDEPAPPVDGGGPPQIVHDAVPTKPRRKGGAFKLSRTGTGFTLPGPELLELPPDIHQDIDRSALTDTAQKLTQKLLDFGIKGRVETIRPGPVITMYEFVPAPGIRVSKIASLADDLAMAMEALQVRIVAPIPGKNVVGIEVPNRTRQKVYLREVLEDDGFAKMTSPLTIAFGKDTEGAPYVGDLSRMPHLLIAGTTGSGKSVSMNSMIMSLLFKASPEDVRFIMIDPKMVELSMYEGIPHLLLPVVQDAQKAPLALRWAVDEMERRYQLIGKLRVKDLKAYNEKVAKIKAGEKLEEQPPEPRKKVVVVDIANGETEEEALARLEQAGQAEAPAPAEAAPPASQSGEFEKLPYIVIIIDELADLMMVASRDVEQCIARLAAKARAAGIHLVIATQRPSTDVISGVIKANLPVRIAFRLASRHDSATIINQPGAERLLGEGDMLHVPPGCSDTQRLHGAWLRETEIERVVDFWKAQGQPVYDEEILRPRADEGGGEGGEESVPDELYDQALAVVCQLERVSISLLQRKMGVGYNRAADLIERMERDRVIGPANGIKPREVLIKEIGESRI